MIIRNKRQRAWHSGHHSRQPSRRLSTGACIVLAAIIGAVGVGSRAAAITINFNYDEEETPAFDPDGAHLQRIAREAADIWSSYILDDRTFEFDLFWDDVEGTDKGKYEPRGLDLNIIADTRLPDGTERDWYFDETPSDNGEFFMQQTLAGATDESAYLGAPPVLLEAGYFGQAKEADIRVLDDLLSTMFHEMGHLLGINFQFEDSYDINPTTLGGADVAVAKSDGFFGGHLAPPIV